MKALILAAGYATRLYPLTKQYPKPLLKVKNRPIIDYIVEKLNAVPEVEEVIVVTNDKFFGRFKAWLRRHSGRRRIRLVNDLTKTNRDRLGAIGDTYFVVSTRRIKSDLLVIGGDNLFDAEIRGFVEFARSKKTQPVIGVYDIGNLKDARHYGVLKLDRRGRVTDFKEKPARPTSRMVAMCLYYFPRERLGLLREYMARKATLRHDATGLYIDWLRKRVSVYGYVFGGRWYDIGDHEFYRQAKRKFVRGGST